MPELPDLKIIDEVNHDFKKASFIFLNLLHKFQEYLNLQPKLNQIQIFIVDSNLIDKKVDFFNFGTIREKFENIILIKINLQYLKFLPFIFLREIMKCFLEEELRDNVSINLAINQMIYSEIRKTGNNKGIA